MVIGIDSSIIFIVLIIFWLLYIFPVILEKYVNRFGFFDDSGRKNDSFRVQGSDFRSGLTVPELPKVSKILRALLLFLGLLSSIFLVLGLFAFIFQISSLLLPIISTGVIFISLAGLRSLVVISRRDSIVSALHSDDLDKNIQYNSDSSAELRGDIVEGRLVKYGLSPIGIENSRAFQNSKAHNPISSMEDNTWSPNSVPRPTYLYSSKADKPVSSDIEQVYDIFSDGFTAFDSDKVVSFDKLRAEDSETYSKAIDNLDDVLQRRRASEG